MEIPVQIQNCIASVPDDTCIVCQNDDYHLHVTFDAPWDAYPIKTARFVIREGDDLRATEIAFTGDTVAVPSLSNVYELYVGVYAGSLRTTTPARIPCAPSIRCLAAAPHEDPSPDVYDQILQLLADIAAYGHTTAGHMTVSAYGFVHTHNGYAITDE